ncbi:hypothetical protein DNTS_029391 [Danionella cerebrum]|uniref:RING-type domain-containing protein n=1 Tax=Danionella cerebrum TaxID=2873325 RepID=A0A553QUM6_9TELE|nr:hypothetical protein DNTS_029391 [Danionella translucida]
MGGQVTRATLDSGTVRCHPLKPNMCSQVPNPMPLSFHAITKGSQIAMDKTQRRVHRMASFCNAITFTNRPVRVYEQVRLKITKTQGCWNGALRMGFSLVNPSEINPAWLPRFACPDLVSERGFWARALPEKHCEEGNVLSFWLDNTGRVFYSVNGGSPVFFFSGVPASEPVWAVIDIYGLTCGVHLLDSRMVPDEYQNHVVLDDWPMSVSCSDFDLQEEVLSLSNSPNALNSALSPQLSDELHFHSVHGNALRLLTEHVALRFHNRRDESSLVFTNRPLRCGECVFLKVTLRSSARNGFLSYGFTSCNPAHLNSNYLPVNPDDLLDRKEFWAFNHLTSPLLGGDIIGFRATTEGEVLVSHNGDRAYREMCVDSSTPLWMIFHLKKNIKQISILGSTCSYSSSCSEIQRSILTNAGSLSADRSLPRPQSLTGSTGTASSFLSSNTASPSAVTGDECVICCEQTVDSVLYSCGHMCVCSVCGGKLMEMLSPSCPMCRSPIRDIIRIYRSM